MNNKPSEYSAATVAALKAKLGYYEFSDMSKWYGKKIVGYGDSLTGRHSWVTTGWLGKVAAFFGMVQAARYVGGRTVEISHFDVEDTIEKYAWVSDGTPAAIAAGLGEYGEYVDMPLAYGGGSATQPANTVQILSSMERDDSIGTIPLDADIIMMFGGANSMTNTAYRTTLNKIYARCPNAKVFLISLPYHEIMDTTGLTDYTTLRNTIKTISEDYGYPVVELRKLMGVNILNFETYLADTVHYNETGYELMARCIAGVLRANDPVV